MVKSINSGSDDFVNGLIKDGWFIQVAQNLNNNKVVDLAKEYILNILSSGTTIISVVGGAGSGKSTFTERLTKELPTVVIAVLITDSFSIGTRHFRQKFLEDGDPLKKYDFDLLRKKVIQMTYLKAGETTSVPVYNEESGAGVPVANRAEEAEEIDQPLYKSQTYTGAIDLIIVEGDFQPLESPDFIIYIHLSDEQRLKNRINRDLTQRGETSAESVARSFEHRQIRQHLPYTLPVARNANLLLYGKTTVDSVYVYDVYIKTADGKD